MSKFIDEFREFISRGNVMDLAVAVVVGGAFTSIVNSLVSDIIMPIISLVTGGIDFSAMKIVIGVGENAAAFTYGNFINAVIQFLLIAFVVFLMVKALNRAQELNPLRKKEEEAEPEAAPTCPYCLEEVKKGATRCPHCAGAFDAPAGVQPEEDNVSAAAAEMAVPADNAEEKTAGAQSSATPRRQGQSSSQGQPGRRQGGRQGSHSKVQ